MRILALLRTLGQGRTPTVHELAVEFHTRRETIYRDLRVLEDAGYPITGDEHGKLSRPRLLSSPIPDLRFSGPELEALLVADAQAPVAIPAAETLESAVLKLKFLAKSSSGPVPAGADGLFETWTCGAKDFRPHEGNITLLIEAILRKRHCRVEYRSPADRNRNDMNSILIVCYLLEVVSTWLGASQSTAGPPRCRLIACSR